MSNDTTIKGTSISEFKKIIEEGLGRPLKASDVAVAHDVPTYSGEFQVSKISTPELREVAKDFAKEFLGKDLDMGDVAVVTANDMNEQHQLGSSKRNKMK